MDVNGDGNVDILSGSYSRMERDMAGLFQVLWGREDGSFRKAETLKGTDGEPLIIAADEKHVTDKICTRPTAVDFDGDGKLDIVAGNFTGTFALFRGEGDGRFAPKNTILSTDGKPLRVRTHSDPCFVDWDADGDLDLVSGSGQGGVVLFENEGSATEPVYGDSTELIEAVGYGTGELRLGDGHLTGPQAATRVWIDDVNADGKFDILVGDSTSLSFPAKGLDEATARARFADWQAEERAVMQASRSASNGERTAAARKKFQADYNALRAERAKIVQTDRTGFVWVYYQK